MNLNSTDAKEIKKFGIIALLFFGVLFGIGLWLHKTVPILIFGGLSILGVGFILIPAKLRGVYSVWLKIAHFLGKTITVLILSLAYYLVITPTAIIKRIVGGTSIPIKIDRNSSSYWVNRAEIAQPRDRFFKRY